MAAFKCPVQRLMGWDSPQTGARDGGGGGRGRCGQAVPLQRRSPNLNRFFSPVSRLPPAPRNPDFILRREEHVASWRGSNSTPKTSTFLCLPHKVEPGAGSV